MKSAVVVLLIAMSSLAESGCNTWYLVNKDGDCECGSDLSGRLKCNDCAPNKTVAITAGFCMTYDTTGLYARGENSSSLLIAGDCPYGTFSNTTSRKFTTLPTDPTQVNSSQCSPYNRRGLFCGECLVGFGPAAHSFDLHCSNCSHMSTATAISLYLVLELLPITVFFFVVLAFRPSLMTGPQLGYDMLLNSELLASWVVALSLIPHTLMLLWVLCHVLQRFKCLSRSVEAVQRQPLVQRLLSLTSGRVYALQQTEDESLDDEEETQPLLY
ncbi:hypothetical protein GBAR_LOCUS31728 [Geodia barretti]|uniref:Uncharacterized protein n=1 Tax=Geodia barretti TaxID=519541 RepID=A0AA35XMT8_GEOBA|nr:hypothetical protein GBAR_LOCUS31728 [Geodia barretti]